MRFLDLRNQFRDFAVLSVADIRKAEADFDGRRLVEWQKKGYIKKIIKGYYIFSDLEITEPGLFAISNRIYAPSYVSFEMALSSYRLIPESVYGITAATTGKTAVFKTSWGDFIYRSIKPEAFFGYSPVPYRRQSYLMADMEKAVLDFFYLNPDLKTADDFESLRINREELRRQLNRTRLEKYLAAVGNRELGKRMLRFLKFMSF